MDDHRIGPLIEHLDQKGKKVGKKSGGMMRESESVKAVLLGEKLKAGEEKND